MAVRVLVVGEPAPEQADLQRDLWLEGCETRWVDASSLSTVLASDPPDAAVVDPTDTVSLERLAVDSPGTPVICVSSTPDCVERVRQLFPAPTRIRLGSTEVDLANQMVTRDGQTQRLTATEAKLLRFLVAHPDRVVSADELRRKVWAYQERVRSRAVENAIYRLRRKLEPDPRHPRCLVSVYGVGYRLVLDEGAASRDPPAGNLPTPRDTLVGRSQDLDRMSAALGRGRVMTLTGPGGSGKTRLAVVLAPASPAVQLGHALLGRGATLLVLDNCEQVVDHVAELASAWLDAAPLLAVLATSRRALRIRGEQRWPVPCLSLPSGDDLCAARESAAVSLLVARAQARDPTFHLDENTVAGVIRVARLVDGLPLALELAAAQITSRPLTEVVEALQQSLESLTADERDRPDRHRSVWAAIHSSSEQLEPHERAGLAALSVFEGAFTAEAAAAVLGDAATSVTNVLRSLADHHLVQRTGTGSARLLWSVRSYARDALEPGDAVALRTRHAQHYASAPPTLGALDDLVAACRFALGQRDAPLALRLAEAAWTVGRHRGFLEVTAELAEAVLALDPGPADRARACRMAGDAASRAGHMARALGYFEDARASAERAGDTPMLARAIGYIGTVHTRRGATAEALRAHREALALGQACGELEVVGVAKQNLAYHLRYEGEFEQARALYIEALQALRAIAHHSAEADVLCHLGVAHAYEGRFEEARDWLQQGLAVARAHDDRRIEAEILGNLGNVAADLGDPEAAIDAAQTSLCLAREVGDRRSVSIQLGNLGDQHLVLGDAAAARGFLDAAVQIAREVSDRTLEGHWLGRLGAVHTAQGRYAAADRCFEQGDALLDARGTRWHQAVLLATWARLQHRRGDREGAAARLDVAEAIARDTGLSPTSAFGASIRESRAEISGAADRP